MRLKLIYTIVLSLLFSGCSTQFSFDGVPAKSPKIPGMREYGQVTASLNPTLTWHGSENQYYDLIIWEVIGAKCGKDIFTGLGDPVVYAESIKGTSYTIEEALEPDCPYLWSVRVHGNPNWSYYNTKITMHLPYAYTKIPYRLYSFYTPLQ